MFIRGTDTLLKLYVVKGSLIGFWFETQLDNNNTFIYLEILNAICSAVISCIIYFVGGMFV